MPTEPNQQISELAWEAARQIVPQQVLRMWDGVELETRKAAAIIQAAIDEALAERSTGPVVSLDKVTSDVLDKRQPEPPLPAEPPAG